jgi:hypothetical protein
MEVSIIMGLLNLPFIIASKGRNWWNVFAMGFCFGMAVAAFVSAL